MSTTSHRASHTTAQKSLIWLLAILAFILMLAGAGNLIAMVMESLSGKIYPHYFITGTWQLALACGAGYGHYKMTIDPMPWPPLREMLTKHLPQALTENNPTVLAAVYNINLVIGGLAIMVLIFFAVRVFNTAIYRGVEFAMATTDGTYLKYTFIVLMTSCMLQFILNFWHKPDANN